MHSRRDQREELLYQGELNAMLVKTIASNLTVLQKTVMSECLLDFREVFEESLPSQVADIPPMQLTVMEGLELPKHRPPARSPAMTDVFNQSVKKLEQDGLIQDSSSQCASRPVLAQLVTD